MERENVWCKPKRFLFTYSDSGKYIQYTWIYIYTCIYIYMCICCIRSHVVLLTEHALQPHKAADVTVEVNVEVFVCVTHGYDVIQLFVQVKACVERDTNPEVSVYNRWTLRRRTKICTDFTVTCSYRCAATICFRLNLTKCLCLSWHIFWNILKWLTVGMLLKERSVFCAQFLVSPASFTMFLISKLLMELDLSLS